MVITQQQLIDGFYDGIVDNVGSLVGDRVYDQQGPQDLIVPCITFQIVGDITNDTFKDYILDTNIQVNVYGYFGDGVATTRAINDALVTAFHKGSIIVNDDNVYLQCVNRGIVEITNEVVWVRSEYNLTT